jgi:3-hydroxyisobutyrate dehydrogenase-like beta-hydroxyacid dehydrogenase
LDCRQYGHRGLGRRYQRQERNPLHYGRRNKEGSPERHAPAEFIGKTIVYQCEAGSGQHANLCDQIVIAGTMVDVCESLLYGYEAGLDLDQMLRSISGSAAACWTLNNLAPRILERNFDPGFFVEHFVKDMGIVLEESERMNLTLPGLALPQALSIRCSTGTWPQRDACIDARA